MKKTLIILLSLVTLGLTHQALAERPQRGAFMEELKTDLNMTTDQAAHFDQIMQDQRARRRDLWKSQREEMRTKMQEIHKDTIARLRSEAQLNEQQIQTFLDTVEAHRTERLSHGPQRAPRQQQ
jgi:hypothetical protein